ncbi:MAG: histidine phosphatase family protein, partial [Xenococcaceae cyanobacterium]
MATRVIIVRHGQSSYNAQKIIQGRCDESVLTEKGRADAEIVGESLKKLKFAAIYSSPLQRATETAKTIHDRLISPPAVQAMDKLMEIDLPLWEKLKKDDVKAKFTDDYRNWKQRPHEFKMMLEGGEHYPVLALYEQASQFWRQILPQHPEQTILIVAHN